MKKTFMVLVCLMSLLAVVLCGCNNHKHTFDTQSWEFDANSHWHKATCEHSDVKGDEAKHEFEGNVCKVCKYDKSTSVHKHDSSTLLKEEAVDATCTEKGKKEHYKCKVCGKLFEDADGNREIEEADVEMPAKGHDTTLEHVIGTVSTCTTKGVKEHWVCNSCGQKFDNEAGGNEHEIKDEQLKLALDPDKHPNALNHVDAKEANCASEGNIEYYECEDCHNKYKSNDGRTENKLDNSAIVIPVNENHLELKHVDATEGTCVKEGVIEHYECERCGSCFTKKEGGEKIDKVTVLNPYKHEGELEKIEAFETCEGRGQAQHYKCNACNKLFSDPEGQNMVERESDLATDPLEHSYDFQQAISDGDKGHHYLCRGCNQPQKQADSDETLILAHEYQNGICKYCGYDANHVHKDLIHHGLILPTCEKNGTREYWECSEETCKQRFADEYGFEEIEDINIEKTGHVWEISSDDSEHWLVCKKCGKDAEDSHSPHIVKGGVCTASEDSGSYDALRNGCNMTMIKEKDGILYSLDGDNYYVYKIADGNSSKDLVISDKIDDKDVVGIRMSAFSGSMLYRNFWNSLFIPKSVKEIMMSAFYCADIYRIYYGGSKEEWEQVTIGNADNDGIRRGDNLFFLSEQEPSEDDYEQYYHKVNGEYVIYERHINVADKPNYGVKYELKDEKEYKVTAFDMTYFYAKPQPWIINIWDKYNNDYKVTQISSLTPQGNGRQIGNYGVIIPKEVKQIDSLDISIITIIYYMGEKSDWDEVSKDNISSFKVAYYANEDPQKSASEGLYWHEGDDGLPELWMPKSETNGVTLKDNGSDYTVTGVEANYTKIVIPDKIGEKSVTKIEFDAFQQSKVGDLEWIIIPKTINEFLKDRYNGYYQFQNQPATVFYEGTQSEWNQITNQSRALTSAMGDSRYNKYIYFYSEIQPSTLGRYWHYENDIDKTPVIWTGKDGKELPPELVEEDNVQYLLAENCAGYRVLEYLNAKDDLAIIKDTIEGLPVKEIMDYAFAESRFKGKKIIIPESITKLGAGFSRRQASNYITVFYKGENEAKFKQKTNYKSTCGIELSLVYYYTDQEDPGEGRFWKYGEDGKTPEIYVRERITYSDDNNFTYEYDEKNKTATIIGYRIGTNPILKIPETVTIEGQIYNVTAIGEDAFVNAKGLIGVDFGTKITTIKERAFYNISSLKWVIFYNTITNIANNAFFEIDTLNDSHSAFDSVGAAIYFEGSEAEWSTFTTKFPDWTKANGLQNRIGVFFKTDNKPTFGADAYWYRDSNNENAPKRYSVNTMVVGKVTYEYNTTTQKAAVKSADSKATSIVLLDKLTINNIDYPVEEILSRAFYTNDYSLIKSIVISDSITKIGDYAFSGIYSFALVIGDSVKTFSDNAFNGCSASIYYKGDEAQFNANETLKTAVNGKKIYYLQKVIPAEGDVSSYWHFADKFELKPKRYNEPSEWLDRSSFLRYSYNSATNTATVIGYEGYQKETLVIPETINISGRKYTVNAIGETAFGTEYNSVWADKLRFSGIILPDTITTIADNAFDHRDDANRMVDYIVLGKNIQTIGYRAFTCAFNFQAKLYFRGTDLEFKEFKAKIGELEYGSDLLKLSAYTYLEQEPNAEDYDKVTLGRFWHFADTRNTVVEAWHEFEYTTDPGTTKSMTYIMNSFLKTAILVGSGLVADTDGVSTLKVPEKVMVNKTEYTVVAIDNSIFEYVHFYHNRQIDRLELPKTIKVIGDNAFSGNNRLKSIVIGDDIEFGENSFKGAFNTDELKIYFYGDKEKWENFLELDNSFTQEILKTNDQGESVLKDGVTVYLYSEELKADEYGVWKYDSDGNIIAIESSKTKE